MRYITLNAAKAESLHQEKGFKMTKTSFTTLTVTQVEFLEQFLRGTGKSLSEAQAKATYGIQNLRARMTDLRQAGLVVRREKNTEGRAKYSVSARDVYGSRAKYFTAAN
jgi:hypothetical protein